MTWWLCPHCSEWEMVTDNVNKIAHRHGLQEVVLERYPDVSTMWKARQRQRGKSGVAMFRDKHAHRT